MRSVCDLCPRRCALDDGETGFCGARKNTGGVIRYDNYGEITSIALDPIEKKPLRDFCPGTFILSAGSYGCNLRCPFCQNHDISMPEARPGVIHISPEELVERAESLKNRGNIGIAYTYNEPLISYEYVMDCARIANSRGLKNALVTNGYINEEPLAGILPYIDAMNIDLKSFDPEFYRKIGGDLETVKKTIAISSREVHVEVTTLIIPGENDGFDEMENLSSWLSEIDSGIPYHISRFFPRYKYSGLAPTPTIRIYALAETARKRLRRVYTGNC